jgi:uncharacterized protein (DUF427 family)
MLIRLIRILSSIEGHLSDKDPDGLLAIDKTILFIFYQTKQTKDKNTLSNIKNYQSSIMTKKATWNGATLAESDKTIIVENNHYFPPDSIKKEFFKESGTHTTCGWKGEASYYTVVVDGKENKDAAWYYPETKEAANNIKGYIAFWKGVKVE